MSSFVKEPKPPPSLTYETTTYMTSIKSSHLPPLFHSYTYKTLPAPPTPSGHASTNTGLCPWHGCYVLCDVLPAILDILPTGVEALELGAGVGITGSVVGQYYKSRNGHCGNVTLTDGMEDVLELLKSNLPGMRCERNFWMEGERLRRYGFVFGSDLVYERR